MDRRKRVREGRKKWHWEMGWTARRKKDHGKREWRRVDRDREGREELKEGIEREGGKKWHYEEKG